VQDALGPGTPMAGRFLIPVTGAVAVIDTTTGTEVERIPVSRNEEPIRMGGRPITSAALGDTLLEQRGDELVALRADG